MSEQNIENVITPTPDSGSETVEIIGINFREAGKIYYFSPGKHKLSVGNKVIVETSRGTEIGTVKTPNKFLPTEEIVSPLKEILRPATEDDLIKDEKNRQAEFDAAVICKRKIANHGLDMSLVAAE